MRVLVVEDDDVLCGQVRSALASVGYAVDVARDGEEAQFLGETEPYDLIILDLGLPVRDGLSVLKAWRRQTVSASVLILTARDGWADRVDGLDAGADDFLTKPFHIQELLARARALLRRKTSQTAPVFESRNVSFDTRTGQVLVGGESVGLTGQEAAVLSYLFHNADRFVSPSELAEHIYRYNDDRDSNTIAVFVNRLRKKLGPELIRTERGRGYLISVST